MQTISFIITNSGDGSNGMVWLAHTLSTIDLCFLEESNPERFSSGDGVQYTELKFPDSLDLRYWAYVNNIEFVDYDTLVNEVKEYLSWK